MDWSAASDPALRYVAVVGTVCAALTGAVLLYIFVLRVGRRRRVRHERAFLTLWRGALTQRLLDPAAPLPRLDPADGYVLIRLWTHLQESLQGEMQRRLIDAAAELDLRGIASRLLRDDGRMRLLTIIAVGHLRDPAFWDTLAGLLPLQDPMSSLAAAHALVRLDADRALPRVLPLFAEREDWAPGYVQKILEDAGIECSARCLTQAIAGAPDEQLERLLAVSSLVPRSRLQPQVLERLARTRLPRAIAACLRQLEGEEGAEAARPYLTHDTWFVRLRALVALAPAARPGDVDTLMELLRDSEWWVRVRAGEVLHALPFLSAAQHVRVDQLLAARPATLEVGAPA